MQKPRKRKKLQPELKENSLGEGEERGGSDTHL